MADLAQIGSELVGLFAAQLKAQDVELPERQYFAPGQIPAWDGDQLVGWLVSVDQGQPGAAVGGTFHPSAITFSATFAVGLLRPVPVIMGDDGGSLELIVPSAEELDVAGQALISDAQALLNACQRIHQQYLATDPGMGFEVGPVQTIGPEGGLAGPKILMTVSLS